jgi:hypothetical protein
MPQAYYIYKLRRMPEADQFGSHAQLQLRLGGTSEPQTAHTLVTKSQTGFREGVDRYTVKHDYLVKLKYPGRVREIQFSEYVAPYNFPIFVVQNSDGEPSLIVQTKGKVASDFIKRMTIASDFLALERQLDFQILRPQLQVITGAWFAQMQGDNISSTAVFGAHVDRSSEFIDASRVGTLRVLYGPYECNDSTFPLSIHSNGGVVLYGAFDTEQEPLDVVLHIKRNLLDLCWAM